MTAWFTPVDIGRALYTAADAVSPQRFSILADAIRLHVIALHTTTGSAVAWPAIGVSWNSNDRKRQCRYTATVQPIALI